MPYLGAAGCIRLLVDNLILTLNEAAGVLACRDMFDEDVALCDPK